MIFCRYCGAQIADDSVFCSKCGKRLTTDPHPAVERVVQTLRLKTPYPYFLVLVLVVFAWMIGPPRSRPDYSNLNWSIEVDRNLDLPAENLFQQSLSLVVENTGTMTMTDVPIELSASIEPAQDAEVIASVLGRSLSILQHGRPLPLVVLLDAIEPGAKKRYVLEGAIYAEPPFKVTYEVREERENALLVSHVVEH